MTEPKILLVSRSYNHNVLLELYCTKSHSWAITRRAPGSKSESGCELKYCLWHSDPNYFATKYCPQSQKCYTQNPSSYGFWNDKYECYDLCWKEAQQSKLISNSAIKSNKSEIITSNYVEEYENEEEYTYDYNDDHHYDTDPVKWRSGNKQLWGKSTIR